MSERRFPSMTAADLDRAYRTAEPNGPPCDHEGFKSSMCLMQSKKDPKMLTLKRYVECPKCATLLVDSRDEE